MIKIKITGNYDVRSYLGQTPGSTGSWGDLRMVTDGDECDVLLVCNRPLSDIRIRCLKGQKWLLIQEPPYEKNTYFKDYFRYFDHVVSHIPAEGNFTWHREPAMLPWHIGMTYDELIKLDAGSAASRKNSVIWITSNSNMNPGHSPRLNFLQELIRADFSHEIFGRGIKPVNRKSEVLLASKYSIAIENYADTDYWTEKIADSFLAWTMPFYYGCSNLEKYFPGDSFVRIDINRPSESLQIIEQTIRDSIWEKKLDAIAEARERVLTKYNLFPAMKEKIQAIQKKYARGFIPANPNSNWSRIKRIFR
jgi:hypothetical protein